MKSTLTRKPNKKRPTQRTLPVADSAVNGSATRSKSVGGNHSSKGRKQPGHPDSATSADELYARAESLLTDPNLLKRIEAVMQARGYAGDPTPPLLTYVALASRLLDTPLKLVLVAPSSAGKNRAIEAALELVPPEAVHVIHAASPMALIYSKDDFQHKVIVMAEADSIADDGRAASVMRSLISESRVVYEVAPQAGSGEHNSRRIEKDGPTGLITTKTKSLPPQMGTRTLEIFLQDDPDQTRAVMVAQARKVQGDVSATPVDVSPYMAAQRWLEVAGTRQVVIPFAEMLAHIVPADHIRMRRDFRQLLTAIEAIALLYQVQRRKTDTGAVVATLDDYEIARRLLGPIFQAVAADGLTPAVRQTVEAIGETETTISEVELRARLGLRKSAVSERVKKALAGGWLFNDECRFGMPAKLRRGDPLPDTITALPTVEAVRRASEGEPAAETALVRPKSAQSGPASGRPGRFRGTGNKETRLLSLLPEDADDGPLEA
jgi:hypothetical protein